MQSLRRGQGIGAGLVEAYLKKGYRVVATSRSISSNGNPDVLAVAGDIGDPATGPRVIEEALKAFGRIDTLVNNAGIFVASPFTAYTAEQYGDVVATNLDGFFHITQSAIGAMGLAGGASTGGGGSAALPSNENARMRLRFTAGPPLRDA